MHNQHAIGRQDSDGWRWEFAALALVVIAGLGLRFGTQVLARGNIWDEKYMRVPIEDLLNKGWTIATAIDFTESKGPGFVWPYAIAAEAVGATLNDLRLITLLFFFAGFVPLLLTCRLCAIRGPPLMLVAMFYVLLPQHATLSQLLMSEPSFIFGGLCLMLAFVWGFGTSAADERRIAGPIVFGLILAVLLHHRVHAVAFAGAAALVAFERDRARSWPWWLACLIAGLVRIPLWLRWGGLVSPAYQQMHHLGIEPANLTYMAAGLLPVLAVFLWPAMIGARASGRRWMVIAGAAIGASLAVFAPVDMGASLHVIIPGEEFDAPVYAGFAATLMRTASPSLATQSLLLGGMSIVGMASLGALAALSLGRPFADRTSIVLRLQMWTFLGGCGMYMLTSGYVFDRFIMSWAVLLPIAWTAVLPRWLRIVQAIGLTAMLALTVRTYLM